MARPAQGRVRDGRLLVERLEDRRLEHTLGNLKVLAGPSDRRSTATIPEVVWLL